MIDNREPPRNSLEADRPATQREWARKHYLRGHMREDALPADEFKLLDERLARWTADRQRRGRLPSDYEPRAKSYALVQEFRNNRDEARPIFAVEEQRDVDASRAASSLRDRIEGQEDLGALLRQISVQYAISNALGEFDARKRVSDRFGELYGRSPAGRAVFLLEVAHNEGCSPGDLRKVTGMPLPTLSRILWALSTKRQNGAEPYRLIEQDYAPDNRRRQVIRLSARGRAVISRVTAIMNQTAA